MVSSLPYPFSSHRVSANRSPRRHPSVCLLCKPLPPPHSTPPPPPRRPSLPGAFVSSTPLLSERAISSGRRARESAAEINPGFFFLSFSFLSWPLSMFCAPQRLARAVS
ncbi:MAG: hypothetical protein BJ554DRAFT_459 [Olpidium bornovanus]|uniref:Uncharacterized protein n=1 Tax=Olpidium bornovanus TaxID=278681 RepID=A0A8H8DI50_9FUNG|nr:MAG: hypothetical protein BJ554DRAFT_459 [Olpidium bornovanus]